MNGFPAAFVSALIANGAALAWALDSGFRPIDLIAVYCAQSVTYGFFHAARICLLRRFHASGDRREEDWSATDAASRGWETASVRNAQYHHAGLFLAIWLSLHFGAALFTAIGVARDLSGLVMDQAQQVLLLGLFLLQQAYVLILDVRRDRRRAPEIGVLRRLPFARLAPLLLVIYLGALASAGTALLWVLAVTKTVGDSLVQLAESRSAHPTPAMAERR